MPIKQIITLSNKHGMQIKLSNWGATWLSCILPVDEQNREVLLGCQTFEQYEKQDAYLGATIGRYANRIANATIDIDNRHYPLVANQGVNQLHGGKLGFDKQLWHIQSQSDQQITFTLTSPDGDQGFPGELNVEVTYQLTDDNKVVIKFKATTTKTTPVNLTNHAYFNLDGETSKDILNHTLQVNANLYLPVDSNGIPSNDLVCVTKNDMDLRKPRLISDRLLASLDRQITGGYDHAYLLDKNQAIAAKLVSSDKKVTMNITTTKPSLQVYTGNFLQHTPNRHNGEYDNFAGIALETQFLPDSPHHPKWPQESCWLQPNQIYSHQTTYQFTCRNSSHCLP
ncbi:MULTISPECIES: galactose-1-epimerase [unclassified Gilliamella]|uniref:galactose-1-epimerase n=1 Tax=unclassified Gilliamella TaxID=2685620 RepID=UPI00130ADCC9|nr:MULTISPECIES: galactose-1-epimerase [unclassified Gilliamella]MWP49853.1 galactose-1-epimerase [Gilliamella sp. Lep-s35]MWP69664.1 galactose-1-epimerase [Gilliamella sp. Lep-s5]MWP77814.1 galactose-1-epimerase [Gilliamella sp. Lep-s21]